MPIYRNQDGEPEPKQAEWIWDLAALAFVSAFGVPTLIAAVVGVLVVTGVLT